MVSGNKLHREPMLNFELYLQPVNSLNWVNIIADFRMFVTSKLKRLHYKNWYPLAQEKVVHDFISSDLVQERTFNFVSNL